MKLAKILGHAHRDADRSAEQGVKSVDPKDLRPEDDAKIARDRFSNRVEVEFAAELLLHGSNGLGGYAAGNDQVEEAEVGVHIEGEAVRGHEAGDVDADRS